MGSLNISRCLTEMAYWLMVTSQGKLKDHLGNMNYILKVFILGQYTYTYPSEKMETNVCFDRQAFQI